MDNVIAYPSFMAIHTSTVDQNVYLVLIVKKIKHVFKESVLILASAHVAKMQIAKL